MSQVTRNTGTEPNPTASKTVFINQKVLVNLFCFGFVVNSVSHLQINSDILTFF